MSTETLRLIRGGGGGGGYRGGGRRRLLYLSLHCHHQNDSCVKMGSDESHFYVSLIVRDKVTRQCPETTIFEEKGEPKWIWAEVSLLTIIICCAAHLQKMMPCALLHWVQTFCDQQIHWILALSHTAVWQYFLLCLTCLSYFLCRLRHYQSCALYFGTPSLWHFHLWARL